MVSASLRRVDELEERAPSNVGHKSESVDLIVVAVEDDVNNTHVEEYLLFDACTHVLHKVVHLR